MKLHLTAPTKTELTTVRASRLWQNSNKFNQQDFDFNTKMAQRNIRAEVEAGFYNIGSAPTSA